MKRREKCFKCGQNSLVIYAFEGNDGCQFDQCCETDHCCNRSEWENSCMECPWNTAGDPETQVYCSFKNEGES